MVVTPPLATGALPRSCCSKKVLRSMHSLGASPPSAVDSALRSHTPDLCPTSAPLRQNLDSDERWHNESTLGHSKRSQRLFLFLFRPCKYLNNLYLANCHGRGRGF